MISSVVLQTEKEISSFPSFVVSKRYRSKEGDFLRIPRTASRAAPSVNNSAAASDSQIPLTPQRWERSRTDGVKKANSRKNRMPFDNIER